MALYINIRRLKFFTILTSNLIVFIVGSSFVESETFLPANEKNSSMQWNLTESDLVTNSQNMLAPQLNKSNYTSANLSFAYPYFPLIYSGVGVDHMNINIVNLSLTGLIVGDEIGVFDGSYCVGSAIIEEKDLIGNGLSIPASANENTETKPNGYIEGHKITLKAYRSGTIYILYFQTVNNSGDIFEKGESMFAFVDLSQSEEQSPLEDSSENPKIYPNPFGTSIRIEVNLSKVQQLTCEIFDITGKLIKTLFKGVAEGQQLLIWDGKDNRMHLVSPGLYFCRLNQSTTKIIYLKH